MNAWLLIRPNKKAARPRVRVRRVFVVYLLPSIGFARIRYRDGQETYADFRSLAKTRETFRRRWTALMAEIRRPTMAGATGSRRSAA